MNTYLYRLWDETDRLLYVGISKSAIHRLHEHLTEQPWAEQVAKQTIERYATREEAAQAEAEAIRSEAPLYNVIYNKANKRRCVAAQNEAQSIARPIRRMQDRWAQKRFNDALVAVNNMVITLGQEKHIGQSLAFDDLVRSLPYLRFADTCWQCFEDSYLFTRPMCWPVATFGDGNHVYECHLCGARWTCWYAASPVSLSQTEQVLL